MWNDDEWIDAGKIAKRESDAFYHEKFIEEKSESLYKI